MPRLVAVVLTAAMLGGCASQLSQLPVIGVPANTPARPDGPAIYPAVHDVPPPREQAVLEPEERARIQKELVAARDQQAKEAPEPGNAAKSSSGKSLFSKPSKKKTSQAE